MTTRIAYCPSSRHNVRLVSIAPQHGASQATLHDVEPVCVDYGMDCRDPRCPVCAVPSFVMGVRLARSGLGAERMHTRRGLCECCGHVVDLLQVDEQRGICPVCEGANRL